MLLADDRERGAALIRRAIAAHGRSASDVFAGHLPSDLVVPDGIALPADPVWMTVILWTASQFDRLPPGAIEATLELYSQWMLISAFIEDPVTPILLERIAELLVAYVKDDERISTRLGPIDSPAGPYHASRKAVQAARTMIALHAKRAPNAVSRYLSAVSASERVASDVEELLEFPGTLASTAPADFASVIVEAVEHDIRMAKDKSSTERYDRPFWRLDAPFVMGRVGITLFLEILKADENAGILMTRRLLRLVEQWTNGDAEALEIELLGSERRVVSLWSYGWSRGRCPSYLLSAALCGLEEWAHQEIDAGRNIDDIAECILGDDEISGSLLLIIVDLVLSHGATTDPILWDLLASPETLALDTHRYHYDIADQTTDKDIIPGFSGRSDTDRELQKRLRERTSRKLALYDAIPQIIWSVDESKTLALRERLESAVRRIGTWDREVVDWFSPQFLASHAVRSASRLNYERATELGPDGKQRTGWQFVWPEPQKQWLEAQSARVAADQVAFSMGLALRMAMNDDKRDVSATVEMAEQVLQETTDVGPSDSRERPGPSDPWINRIAAAAFLMRYGSVEALLSRHGELEKIFDEALAPMSEGHENYSGQIMYDPRALAVSGLLYSACRFNETGRVRRLLRAVSENSSNASTALLGHRGSVEALGSRAVQAAVRVGIEACVFARSAHYDEDPDVYAARLEEVERRQSNRLAQEDAWLFEGEEMPSWSCPPQAARKSRPRFRVVSDLPGPAFSHQEPKQPDFYFDSQTAANWTRCLTTLGDEASEPVKALIAANREWLVDTNGGGEDDDEHDIEWTWTTALMERTGEQANLWSPEERQVLVFDVLEGFSDAGFISATSTFLVQSDLQHIEGDADQTLYLVELRQIIWKRLKETRHWHLHVNRYSSGIEVQLKRLVAAFFFKVSYGLGPEQSYTGGLRSDQVSPFLPILTEIAVNARACPIVAAYLVDALEIVDYEVAASFALKAAYAWTSDADFSFWNELGIGRRVCVILKAVKINPDMYTRAIKIADAVSAAGVVEGEVLRAAATQAIGRSAIGA